MDDAWARRQNEWRRFNEWEAARLRNEPPDFQQTLRHMWEAWQLAKRTDPRWDTWESALAHVEYLTRIRSALSRLGSTK